MHSRISKLGARVALEADARSRLVSSSAITTFRTSLPSSCVSLKHLRGSLSTSATATSSSRPRLTPFTPTERYGYKSEDMVILMDSPNGTAREQPTRANIVSRRCFGFPGLADQTAFQSAAMRWLVSGAQPNDSLFFHCERSTSRLKWMRSADARVQ